MVAEHQVLLQPCCPPADDPETLEVLSLLANVAEAPWAELHLQPDGATEVHVYHFGGTGSDKTSLNLILAGRYSGTLLLGGAPAVDGAFSSLASFMLDKILQSRRLREQVVLLKGALDITASSILLFDSSCDIVYANPPADALLSRQTEDGLAAHRPGGPQQPLFTLLYSLVERIGASRDASPSWNGSLELSDGSIVASEVMRVDLETGDRRSAVLVHLKSIDPVQDRLLYTFSHDYHLSPREEDVVRLVIEGLTSAEMAERLGISPHTVRDHIKRVYRKTCTSSRSDLLGLVTRTDAITAR